MIRIAFISFFSCIGLSLMAQTPEFYHHGAYHKFDRFLSVKSNLMHTSIKPYRLDELQDTGYLEQDDTIRNGFWKRLYKYEGPFSNEGGVWLMPLVEAMGGMGFLGDSSALYNPTEIGLVLQGDIGERWSISAGGSYMHTQVLPHRDSIIGRNNIIPGHSYARSSGTGYWGWNWQGKVRYSPNKFFDLEIGKGKHFIGDGYRSLLLSDNAINYPYLRADVDVWHVHYMALYSLHYHIPGSGGDPDKFRWKYATSHYIDWSISRSVSLGFFESVVWQAKDTLLNRQFDVNYLNPVIFYRPVEYSLGSSDNSIMGLNLKVKITDKHQVYGQFVIDEFLLSKFKLDIQHAVRPNDTSLLWGWWANKYGIQIGYKGFDLGGVSGLDLQTELNFVRPYTFTHGTTTQNYAHFNQPLAHPLGANFVEHTNIVWYTLRASKIRLQINWALYGRDSSYLSYGGDLFRPYTARPKNNRNYVGQGVRNNTLFADLSWEKTLNPAMRLKLRAGVRYRRVDSSFDLRDSWLIYCGIRTDLWNRYEDY